MKETIDEDVKKGVLDIDGIEEAEHDFEKIDGNWYGPLGFEFRSEDPVEMVELFYNERPEDTIYYCAGEDADGEAYRFHFIVKEEDTRLEEVKVGDFQKFGKRLRYQSNDLPEIAEVNDGFVFDEADNLEEFLNRAKMELVEPEHPISIHYLTPDSVTTDEDGMTVTEGVAINSDVYVRKQNGEIYELKPQD